MDINQVLAELYGCGPSLTDKTALITTAREAVLAEGATIVGEAEARYVPHGLTIALFLAESHMVLTTWPEYRLLMIDVLLCNPTMNCGRVIERMRKVLCPSGRVVTHEVQRVIDSHPETRRRRLQPSA
jgi:S-adenosylmethionine decarboxylase